MKVTTGHSGRWLALVVTCGVVMLGLSGTYPASALAASTMATKTVTLSASSDTFLDTGVMIAAGTSATIKVTGDGTCHAGGAPDCPGGPSGAGITCADAPGGPYPPGPAGPAVPYGSVAGRVGSGTSFEIGSAATTKGPGELYVVFNDCAPPGGYGDNAGSFQVTITVDAKLAGTVYDEQCDSSCQRVGLGGIDLTVSGTDQSGATVNMTSTSANDGTWSADLSPGSYTVTPGPDGFEPPASPEIKLTAGQTVDGLDFQTCEGTPDTGVAPLLRRVAYASGGSNGCVGTYTVTLGANVPQSTFVDPTGDGAGSNRQDGKEYPATNHIFQALLPRPISTVFVNQFDGPSYYPACAPFNYTRRLQLTTAGDLVEWRDYFNRSPDLGTVKVTLAWNRYTNEVVPEIVDPTQGSLTRVFDYQITHDGLTRRGTCSETGTLVPYAIVKPSRNDAACSPVSSAQVAGACSFTILVSWEFPFEVSGGTKYNEVLPPPPPSAKKAIANRISNVPGYKTLSNAQKAICQANALRLAQLVAKNVGWVNAVQKVSDQVKNLFTVGVGEILEGPVSIVVGIADMASAAVDGYPTMDEVLTGQFRTFFYNSKGYQSVGTQLVLDAHSDQFPDYTINVTRNRASLPWSSQSNQLKMNNTFTNPTAHFPLGLPPGLLVDSDTGATTAAQLLGGFKAKGLLLSDMNIVKNVFILDANLSTSFMASLKPGAPGTITYQFLDGKP